MKQNKLTLGSLFDGSGGFPLGGLLAGIEPVWASEIEPFPIRVTTKRLPFIKHYGDVSKLNGGEVEPVDIISFGSPCQDMSVAGKRAGLGGSRSNLFFEAIRIVKEMRCATHGKYPRWLCWENVPGAFSSNGGADFKAVLEAICQIKDEGLSVPEYQKWEFAGEILGDGFSVAWRVLDAQFWGVPQRRKRIFLVADFADGCAGQVLFESEGLSGYSAESFGSWQRAARDSAAGTGAAGFGFDGYNGSVTQDKAATLGVNCGISTGRNGVVLNDQGGNRMDVTVEVTSTLRAQAHHPPCVMEAAGFCTEHSAKARSIGYEEEMSPTLRAGVVPAAVAIENHPADGRVKIENGGKTQTLTSRMGTGGMNVPLVLKIRSGCEGGGKGALIQTDKSATLGCNNDQTLFEPKPYGICSKDSNAMKSPNPHSGIYEAATARTVDCNGGNPSCNQGGIAVVCVDQGGSKSSCMVSKDLAPTLACTHGGEPAVCIQGSMIGRKDRNGPQGKGVNEGVSFTLNATDRHAVYAMTTGSFPNTGKEVSPALLARDYKDATIVTEPSYGIGRDAFNQGKNAQYKPCIEEELSPTLVAKGPGAVAWSGDKAAPILVGNDVGGKQQMPGKGTPDNNPVPQGFYPQMKAESVTLTENKATTLVNGTNPGFQNGVLETDYTVRRLTPTECARLQGFPDWWCDALGTEHPSYGEVDFWAEVFETHREIIGTSCKAKTRKQLLKWLKDPYADAAEYKMWGNGIALPCVFFVLSGIVWAQNKSEGD